MKKEPVRTVNSLGMLLLPVAAGELTMGKPIGGPAEMIRFFPEHPARSVRVTQPFRIAEREVTVAQFRCFRPGFAPHLAPEALLTGVTWEDATAFCVWLSGEEKIPYRLPTEAEWEYVGRNAETFGVLGMLDDPLEWCADWYAPYPAPTATSEENPCGPMRGTMRVVRGGVPDAEDSKIWKTSDYREATTRAGLPPNFGLTGDGTGVFGRHRVGFRVVQAGKVRGKARPVALPQHQREVLRRTPSPRRTKERENTPYFEVRPLLSAPLAPDTYKISQTERKAAILQAGLPPYLMQHIHSPAIVACPNGDLLYAAYTSYREYEPEVSLIASRLRYGVQAWESPEIIADFPRVNDHAPLLGRDGKRLYLIWGCPRLTGAFPFQWITSDDSGATWSAVQFPNIVGEIGKFARQPINSFFRDTHGVLYFGVDGDATNSLLWASKDNGKTWSDTGGRTGGRHTTFCPLSNGAILGMGGKRSAVEKVYMPQFLSRNGGKSWEQGRSPFSHLGDNQRPVALRLASGRLFFATDLQNRNGSHPPEWSVRGVGVALSENDGQTWRVRRMPGSFPHLADDSSAPNTLGYAAACQSDEGMIHLVSSMTQPSTYHFSFNEAWILAGAKEYRTEA